MSNNNIRNNMNIFMVAVAMIILIGGSFASIGASPRPEAGGAGGDSASQCSKTPQQQYAVNETSNGSLQCKQIAYNEISGTPSPIVNSINTLSGALSLVSADANLVVTSAVNTITIRLNNTLNTATNWNFKIGGTSIAQINSTGLALLGHKIYYNKSTCPTGQVENGISSTIFSTCIPAVTKLTANTPLSVNQNTGDITISCSTCPITIPRLSSDIALSTNTPIRIQNRVGTCSSGTTCQLAFNSNLGAFNTVTVCLGQVGITTGFFLVADTLVLTYTSIASGLTSDATQCFEAMSDGGGADTVTGTFAATCSASNLCIIFINEYSGIDIVSQTGSFNSNTSAVTSLACGTGTSGGTAISFTNTPLLEVFYIKSTTGTDTAGANFNLLNGETGSLLYLSEYSNTLTSTSTTFPATVGTSSKYGCISLVIREATQLFTVNLNANTNYIFSINGAIKVSSSSLALWVHQFDSLSTLGFFCSSGATGCSPGTTDSSMVISTTGNKNPIQVWGSITVGANPITLIIEFTGTAPTSTNVDTWYTGTSLILYETSN